MEAINLGDIYPDEVIRMHNKLERKLQAYDEENAWWYQYFQIVSSDNYDPEYADHLRINGISPEAAAKETRA